MSLNGLINSNGLVSFHMKETFLSLLFEIRIYMKLYLESLSEAFKKKMKSVETHFGG